MLRWLIIVIAVLGVTTTVMAEDTTSSGITVTLPADLDPAVRDDVLDALADAGAGVAEVPAASSEVGWQQRYAESLDAAVTATATLGERLEVYWINVGGFAGCAAVAAALLAGLIGWAMAQRYLAPPAVAAGTMPPFRQRVRSASRAAGADAAGIVAFLAISFVVGYVVLPQEPPAGRLTVSGIAQILTVALVMVAIARALASPSNVGARLAPLTDAEARLVWRVVLIVIVLPLPISVFRAVVVAVAPEPAAAVLTVIAAETVMTCLRIWAFWVLRKPMQALLEHTFGNGRGAKQPALIGWFATWWFAVFSMLALLRLLSVITGQLEGDAIGSAADFSFTVIVLLPFVVGGVGAWFDDRTPDDAATEAGTTMNRTVKALAQGAVVVVGVVFVLRTWGIDPFAGSDGDAIDYLAGALLEASAAIVVGWAIWRGVQNLLDRHAPGSGDADMESDGMGKTGSRIDTLIPVFRSAALVVIVVVSSLTALTAIGINIGPLLAGAGVIGLAIGFGAQTMVKDVITGVFYLVEDAFRVGEYIETASGKGVVEKISLRSVRLRHHRGPVYTIPFGAMGTIQNHSRDWVKIKLLLRVPFDTDIEKVRKLIKNVGITMMENPDIAEHIIAPVKSQGVLDVDDSAIVIGVKFICKPGEQFVIRRETYSRIKKAFAENGIEFAPKRVIVEGDTEEGAQLRAKAGAAAAAHMGDAGLDAVS
ncbi:MAG: mechanosensitive ion channel family protein [Pseudomonadota bacterium]